MTVICLTENVCKRHAVTFHKHGFVRIQKSEEIPNYQKNVLYGKTLRTIPGKNKICRLTEVSGAYVKKIWLEYYSTEVIWRKW